MRVVGQAVGGREAVDPVTGQPLTPMPFLSTTTANPPLPLPTLNLSRVYVLTGGGPGTATLYLTQYIYEIGFASFLRNPGLASAASIQPP